MMRCAALAAISLIAIAAPALAAGDPAMPAGQTVTPAAARPISTPPEQYFTGEVKLHPVFPAEGPSKISAGEVTFAPGARSAWHTHPLGQHLIVTAGLGWTQVEGGPIVEMHPGDVIWCPPGVRHWHGASPTTSVTHIALQEAVDGKNVTWMEKVTDEQYAIGAKKR